MWCGWGAKGVWQEPVEPLQRAELEALRAQVPEPWALLLGRSARGHANDRVNMKLADELGLAARSTLFFYEAIEYEPTAPAATLQFYLIRSFFKDEAALRGRAPGVMGNAQQPVMALPNLYFFARCARDAARLEKPDDAVLDKLAALLSARPSCCARRGNASRSRSRNSPPSCNSAPPRSPAKPPRSSPAARSSTSTSSPRTSKAAARCSPR